MDAVVTGRDRLLAAVAVPENCGTALPRTDIPGLGAAGSLVWVIFLTRGMGGKSVAQRAGL
jgi:hypothetical protein